MSILDRERSYHTIHSVPAPNHCFSFQTSQQCTEDGMWNIQGQSKCREPVSGPIGLVPELPVLRELGQLLPTKCAVGPLVIGFVSPVTEEHLRLDETDDLLTVQELFAKKGVERFNPSVLSG
jgi:hypothetical protein